MSPQIKSAMGIVLLIAALLPACQSTLPVPVKLLAPPTVVPTISRSNKTQIPPVKPDAIRLDFDGKTMLDRPGDIQPGQNQQLVFTAGAGQKMVFKMTIATGDGLALSLWGADGIVLLPETAGITAWEGVFPASQDYYLNVRNTGQAPITYQLSVNIPVDASVPLAIAPTAAPAGVPGSDPNTPLTIFGARIARNQIIRYDAGPMTVDINGAVIRGERDVYQLNALAGETLDVIITSMEGNAVFTILGPDDNPLPGTEEGKDINNWTVPIIVEGIYTIVVGSTRGNAAYTLKVSI